MDEEASSSNTGSDEDLEGNCLQDTSDPESNPEDIPAVCSNIIGDLSKEIEQELGQLIERGIEKDLEEAVEKLNVACDLSPSALKYNIEPNTEEPFEKSCPLKLQSVELLEPVTVQQKVENYLEAVQKEVFEPTIVKQDAKDLPKPVTYYQEVEKILEVDVKIHNLPKQEILEPINLILEVPQYPETVTLKEDDSKTPDQETGTYETMKPENLESNLETHPIDMSTKTENIILKTTDASLTNAQDVIENIEKEFLASNPEKMDYDTIEIPNNELVPKRDMKESTGIPRQSKEENKFCKENKTQDEQEKDEDSMVPRKKEKIDFVQVKKRRNSTQMLGGLVAVQRRDLSGRNRENVNNRRSLPAAREKKRVSPEVLGKFTFFLI